jgi:tRNA pseudouridine55 synthase
VDKPAGISSHDVVQNVRRRLGIRTVGHTGTLDPFATGLLVLLLGRATRLARFVEMQSKQYLATARLGIQTTTDDLTGQVVSRSPVVEPLPEEQVRRALARFHGSQLQQPPQYSAKQVGGERSYRKARRGEAVNLNPVEVTIHRIEFLRYHPPDLTFRAVVSAGTYLRAIARDLGSRLGVGAHLTSLRREAIGSLSVEDAVPLDRVGPAAVLPAQAVLCDLPSIDLDDAARKDVTHGRPVRDARDAGQQGNGGAIALVQGGELVAVARAEDGWFLPTVVLESQ